MTDQISLSPDDRRKMYRHLPHLPFLFLALTLCMYVNANAFERPETYDSAIIRCLLDYGSGVKGADESISLNWGHMNRFDTIVLGFNPSFRISVGARGNYQHRDMMRLLELFPVYTLRFPPGTYANFYDWDHGTVSPKLARTYDNETMLRTIESQRKRVGKLIKSDYRSFLKFTNVYHITPYIVLNPYSAGVSNSEKTVNRVRAATQQSVRWELGNELSNYDYRGTSTTPWNSGLYVKRAQAISEYISHNKGRDKIGVDAADLLYERGHISVPKHIRNHQILWNKSIAKISNSYDAIIFHPYINFVPQIIKAGMRDKTALGLCPDISTATARSLVEYLWAFSAAQEVPSAYKRYVAVHFPNKQVWLTEVGLAGAERVRGLDFRASGILRSLFNISYLAHWLKSFPRLGTFMFHFLGEGKGPFSAIYPDGSFNSNAVSYVFLRRLLDKVNKIDVETFAAGSVLTGVGPYRNRVIQPIIAIMAENQSVRRVLFVNLGFSPVTVNNMFTNARVTAIGGLPLVTLRENSINSFANFRAYNANVSSITLEEASLTLIEETNVATQ